MTNAEQCIFRNALLSHKKEELVEMVVDLIGHDKATTDREILKECMFRRMLNNYKKEYLVETIVDLVGHDTPRTVKDYIEQEA